MLCPNWGLQAVAGFSLVESGEGIIWLDGTHGLVAIFLSWIISPIFSGMFAAGLFTLLKKRVLDVEDLQLAKKQQKQLCACITGW